MPLKKTASKEENNAERLRRYHGRKAAEKKFGKADLDEVVEDMKEDKKTKKLPAFFSKLLSGIKIIINRKK